MTLPKTPSFDLTGKRALAEGGAHVTLAARSVDKLEAAAADMTAAGMQVDTLVLDVSDVAATEAAVAAHGPFDILVNSAGLAIHSPAIETTEADFDAVSNLNIKGAYFLTRAVANGLIAAGKTGSLINISSQMAHVGGPDRAVYCATKHAVEGFTKAMAIEWGPLGIRINTICPTFIRTPLTEPTFSDPEKVKWLQEKIKLGRTGEVADMMGAVLYLASDASSLMTGTHMLIDGGWTAD
jgi:NAD(P)-dependent dehydrogenase (short-subunit alcohol dehydrogenase family)